MRFSSARKPLSFQSGKKISIKLIVREKQLDVGKFKLIGNLIFRRCLFSFYLQLSNLIRWGQWKSSVKNVKYDKRTIKVVPSISTRNKMIWIFVHYPDIIMQWHSRRTIQLSSRFSNCTLPLLLWRTNIHGRKKNEADVRRKLM